MTERCSECNGRGWSEYCVNPDNGSGSLDTQIQNLRYEKYKCSECKGTGRIAITTAQRSEP